VLAQVMSADAGAILPACRRGNRHRLAYCGQWLSGGLPTHGSEHRRHQGRGARQPLGYVNEIPALAGSVSPQTSNASLGAGTAGVNALNLRALGPPRTLVLLDGRRRSVRPSRAWSTSMISRSSWSSGWKWSLAAPRRSMASDAVSGRRETSSSTRNIPALRGPLRAARHLWRRSLPQVRPDDWQGLLRRSPPCSGQRRICRPATASMACPAIGTTKATTSSPIRLTRPVTACRSIC